MGWNVLAKRAQDESAFLWLALVIPSLLGLVWLLATRPVLSLGGLLAVGISGTAHSLYFTTLARALKAADLSVVYPYSRGIGAMLATLVGVTVLGDHPSALGWIGIGLTILATFLEPLAALRKRGVPTRGMGLTFLTGMTISVYLVIDSIGVKKLDPVVYLLGIIVLMSVILAPKHLRQNRWQNEWRRSPISILAASFCMAASYLSVLVAMKIAPVSYIVAARASSIALSGLAGVFLFQERVNRARWGAIGLIAAGVYCIGLA